MKLKNPVMKYTSLEILREELKHAIKNCKFGKPAGPAKVLADLLKLIGENSIVR